MITIPLTSILRAYNNRTQVALTPDKVSVSHPLKKCIYGEGVDFRPL